MLFCVLSVTGCNAGDEVRSVVSADDARKVWVFVQINVAEEGNVIEDYYYYARMSLPMYDDIKRNAIARGFLFLQDVRYYGNDDKYHYYRDEDSAGELVFRIEDIKRIELLKGPPPMEDDKPKDKPSKAAAAATPSERIRP